MDLSGNQPPINLKQSKINLGKFTYIPRARLAGTGGFPLCAIILSCCILKVNLKTEKFQTRGEERGEPAKEQLRVDSSQFFIN